MKPQDRTRAILTSRIEPALRLMLVAIADHMSDERLTCWASVEQLGDRTGYCERQARSILDDLEKRGLIRRWSGEHKARDIEIRWDALAEATAPEDTRGGKRTAKIAGQAAKIAPQPAKIAGQEGGKDCHPDRQSLPPRPAKIATPTGKDCPRSDHEATREATREAPTPSARELPPARMPEVLPDPPPRHRPSERRSVEPEVPDGSDWVALLQHEPTGGDIARALIAAGITTLDQLRGRTLDRLRWTKGIGEDRALRIQSALALRGLTLAAPTPNGRAPPGPSNKLAAAEADRQARTRRMLDSPVIDPFAPSQLTGSDP